MSAGEVMPCGRNGDRVTGGPAPAPEEFSLKLKNWTLKYDDWDDDTNLVVGGLARALPDAFGSCGHRLPDSCVGETIPGQRCCN